MKIDLVCIGIRLVLHQVVNAVLALNLPEGELGRAIGDVDIALVKQALLSDLELRQW